MFTVFALFVLTGCAATVEGDGTQILSGLNNRITETVLENDESGGTVEAADVAIEQTFYGSFSKPGVQEVLVVCKILNTPHTGGLGRRAIIILEVDSMDIVAYDEIPIESGELCGEKLYVALTNKREDIKKLLHEQEKRLYQLECDISNLKNGKPIMSYLDDIDVEFMEVPMMCLLSVRKMVQEDNFSDEYSVCFGKLSDRIRKENLTMANPPMVLFHSNAFSPFGLDTEFAVPIEEYVTGTRDFRAGLCLKTVVKGRYSMLSSVYAKQTKWAEQNGYECTGALFEVYVTDPSQVAEEDELITEVYYPIRKI